jgi:hypothetical protein
VQRLVLERLGVQLALGDVAQAADVDPPAGELDVAQAQLHRERRTVPAPADGLGGAAARCGEDLPLGVGMRGEVAGVHRPDHHRERLPDRLALAVAEQLAGRAVERLDHPVGAERDDAVRDVVEHRARVGLAVAEAAERVLQRTRLHVQLGEDRDLRAQDVGDDRRPDEVDGAAGVGGGVGLILRVRGDEDDRGALAVLAQADHPRRLVAVHRRHLDVHQDHGERASHHLAYRRLTRSGLHDLMAQHLEHGDDRQALGGVVVDDHDRREVVANDHGPGTRVCGVCVSHLPSTVINSTVLTGFGM